MQEPLEEQTHVRATVSYTKNKDVALLTIQVWPLPADEELIKTISLGGKAGIVKALAAAGLAERETDLTGKGPMQ